MELKVCQKGHHYDASLYSTCPECEKQEGNVYSGYSSETVPLGATQGVNNGFYSDVGETRPIGGMGFFGETQPVSQGTSEVYESLDENTIPYDRAELGFEPTVGWVVCIKGPDKGKDMPLKYGFNSVGRDPQMKICISGDDQISRQNHCTILYEPDNRKFYMVGNTTNLVYVNGNFVISTTELAANDVIKIGASELMFIPLCGPAFDWKSV